MQHWTSWQKVLSNIKVRYIALALGNNSRPAECSLAQIVKVFPPHDGVVRAVSGRTHRGQLDWSVDTAQVTARFVRHCPREPGLIALFVRWGAECWC